MDLVFDRFCIRRRAIACAKDVLNPFLYMLNLAPSLDRIPIIPEPVIAHYHGS